MSLDTKTKIKLLISLINDEGSNKLEASLEKLTTRLLENLDSHRETILNLLSQA